MAALALALCSLLLGLVRWEAYLPAPPGTPLSALNLEALAAALWSALAGGALAILLGRWEPWPTRMPIGKGALAIVRPIRRAALAFGRTMERVDGTLRQWPAAGLSLLAVAILLGAAMLAR